MAHLCVRVFHCPEAEARLLNTPGQRICVPAWLTREWADGQPAVRVDDPQTLHFDLTPKASSPPLASSWLPTRASGAGSRFESPQAQGGGGSAFKRAQYDEALIGYGRARAAAAVGRSRVGAPAVLAAASAPATRRVPRYVGYLAPGEARCERHAAALSAVDLS